MKREQLERALRERLATYRTMPGVLNQPLSLVQVAELTAALLPWVVEVIEQVESETREACGPLP